ncbi:MAG TPA: CBS domain-containing protein [Capillimicrobium sp.]|nr:CBS domain-containing protein [Capillimicrobium sp.]
MARTVNEVMTHDPVVVQPSSPLTDAARFMRDSDVGDVLVADGGELKGIVTDRDIVVRAIADGRDPSSTKVGDVVTEPVTTVTPDQSASDAARIMREKDVRRLPVVQDGRPVGIVSIGDLAVELDDESALADISASSPNN